MNQRLQALILNEEAQYPSLGRSNIGGWHSRPDFLHRSDANVAALTSWIIWALRRMICATTGQNTFKGTLSISCVGNGLSRRCVPCAPFAPGQRVVRSVLRGWRCEILTGHSAACWNFSTRVLARKL